MHLYPMRRLLLFTLVFAYFANAQAQQATHYVSPTGDDAAAGTSPAAAWRTVQHAMDAAPAGATVEIADGTYVERVECNVNGTEEAPTTFRAATPRQAVLDGNSTGDADAVLALRNRSYVTIEGLVVTNNNQPDAQGILVEGAGTDVTLRDNEIYGINFSANADDEPNENTNAQPLIVYGTDGETPINDLVIEDNLVRDCRPGYSEGVALNGNVKRFRVSGNTVHDIRNIGMDFIGYEGTAPASDRARDGSVTDNYVYDCRSPYATAAGIYVDGGRNISIERNRVTGCQWGIEIGAEAVGRDAREIAVRNNFVYLNDDGGLQIGGFDYPNGSGIVVASVVEGNSFYANDAVEGGVGGVTGELSVSATDDVRITGNIFWVENPAGLALYNERDKLDAALDYNLWYAAGPVEFELGSDAYVGFAAYQTATGQDGNGAFADPQFVDAAAGDLHLAEGSPARDAGDPAFSDEKATDFDGDPRVAAGRVDAGADEYDATSPVSDVSVRPDVRAVVTGGEIRLIGLSEPAQLSVYDRTGRRLTGSSGSTIDARTWLPGVYLVRYTTAQSNGTLPVVLD